MGITLASPPTSETPGTAPRQSRIAWRVIGLFILCALVPLGLCTVFLLREFNGQLTEVRQQRLEGTVRGFGMTLLGRLGSADDVVAQIAQEPSASEEMIRQRIGKLDWVAGSQIVRESAAIFQAHKLPAPSARQLVALQRGDSALVWQADPTQRVRIYLIKSLRSRALL